jgi:hypothetical protein
MISPSWLKNNSSKAVLLRNMPGKLKKVLMKSLSLPQEKELRIVLENIGTVVPLNVEEYIAHDGYMALGKVLTEMTPEESFRKFWIQVYAAAVAQAFQPV